LPEAEEILTAGWADRRPELEEYERRTGHARTAGTRVPTLTAEVRDLQIRFSALENAANNLQFASARSKAALPRKRSG
jgi:hypothetical protein